MVVDTGCDGGNVWSYCCNKIDDYLMLNIITKDEKTKNWNVRNYCRLITNWK